MQQPKRHRWVGWAIVALLALGSLAGCGQGTTTGGGVYVGTTALVPARVPSNDATAHVTIVPTRP